MPFEYEDTPPLVNRHGQPTDWNSGPWAFYMAGTKKWVSDVKGPLFEVFPDHNYRYRRGAKPVPTGPRPSEGHVSDLRFLKALKSHLPDDGGIYPLGILLDICQGKNLGRSNKRQVYHRRIRRLWRKGLVRMFKRERYDVCGRWYVLQEQKGWFVKGDRANKFDEEIGLMIGRMLK